MPNSSLPSTSGRCSGGWQRGHRSTSLRRTARTGATGTSHSVPCTSACTGPYLYPLNPWLPQPSHPQSCQCTAPAAPCPTSRSFRSRQVTTCRAAGNNGAPPGPDRDSNGAPTDPSAQQHMSGESANNPDWVKKLRQLSGEMASDWQYVPPPPPRPSPARAPNQADRLRSFMANLGMVASPDMAAAAALSTASATAQGAAQPTNGAPPPPPPRRPMNAAEALEWGSDWTEDWDPEEDLDESAKATLADEAEALQRASRPRGPYGTPRDKWITPLLDIRSVTGAVDPDQERTEDNLQGEALANKDESQTALRYAGQLFVIPLLTGFLLSRALADPVLSYTLQNNQEAFAMTDRQKIEGAEKVHIEEARLRFDMAIGKIPPLTDLEILEHLREFAQEVQEEERLQNEQNLITVVSDSISSIVLFTLISQSSRGRQALFNTLSRLFDGLSDIAKAVLIILIADTLLGYHSEEGWTALIELLVGHYGFEAEEEGLVIFVGVVPVVIDVFFKYWIFIGLNRISPGAVITLKQIDTH